MTIVKHRFGNGFDGRISPLPLTIRILFAVVPEPTRSYDRQGRYSRQDEQFPYSTTIWTAPRGVVTSGCYTPPSICFARCQRPYERPYYQYGPSRRSIAP